MMHRQQANVMQPRTGPRSTCKTASALPPWSGTALPFAPSHRQGQTPQQVQQPARADPQASEAAVGLAARSWRCSRTKLCSLASDSPRSSSSLTAASAWEMLVSLYKFSRPHTMIGTFVSILSMSALALQSSPGWTIQAALTGLGQALSSALLMNIAIVGINQLHDVEIDKVNKPYLPLASGEMSMEAGTAIVVGSALIGLAIGVASGSAPLLATLAVSLMLGILYSVELPFMRWKRSPVLAASCILAVRAIAVQLGFYFHMQTAVVQSQVGSMVNSMAWLGLPAMCSGLSHLQVTPAISFTVAFMLLFSVVIALFKDIPDTLGDSRAGIRTLTVRLGVPRVFWTCIWILTAAYAGAVIYSVLAAHLSATAASASTLPFLGSLSSLFQATPSTSASAAAAQAAAAAATSGLGNAMPASLSLLGSTTGGTLGWRTLACVAGHCVMAGLLWQRALRTDLTSNKDIAACYMHVWKLFYAEYILIPLLL